MATRLKIENMKLADIKPYRMNAKKHPPEQIAQIIQSIRDFGFNDPIGIWGGENTIVEGHGRYLAAKKMGLEEVPVLRLDHLSDEQRRAYTLIHNQLTTNTGFDLEALMIELSSLPNLDTSFYEFETAGETAEADEEDEAERRHLVDEFIVPPFSVLNTTQDYWTQRREAWEKVLGTTDEDPVLCELFLKWFNVKGGRVLDENGGRKTLRETAEKLGYEYETAADEKADMIFCFIDSEDFKVSPEALKDDRFAVIVTREVPSEKIKEACRGLASYNEIIIPDATEDEQTTQRRGNRCRTAHKTATVLFKGNPKRIRGLYDEIQVSEDFLEEREGDRQGR